MGSESCEKQIKCGKKSKNHMKLCVEINHVEESTEQKTNVV